MARLPRLSLAGQPHHVLQRGHNRQPVFLDDQDRQAYADALREAAATLKVAVQGYALLASEVHLLLVPVDAADLGRLMQSLGRRYVAAFNRRHGHVGTLWEGRFRASVVDARTHLLQVLRCIEQAPVRAGLCAAPADWRWSSAGPHLGRTRDRGLTEPAAYWALGNTPFERELAWQRLLDEPLLVGEAEQIVEQALKGGVVGPGSFLAEVARQVDRPVLRRPRGRPRAMPGNSPKATATGQPGVKTNADTDEPAGDGAPPFP
jgi:putative transposase